jgi:hypothetical protein
MPATQSHFVSVPDCLAAVFPNHATTGPSIRTFRQWIANRWVPTVRVGGRVFLDPEQVKNALERRFRVEAVEAK